MFRRTLATAFAALLAFSMLAAAPADARRGGSFGSRGSRTYSAPAPTSMSPGYVGPVQRSMSAPSAAPGGYQPGYQPGYSSQPGYAQPPRSNFGGFGGGFLGGLVTGGLVGSLLGHQGGGWGGGYGGVGGAGMGGGGLIPLIFQLLVIGGLVWLAVRFFRRRNASGAPFMAGGPQAYADPVSPWSPATASYAPAPNVGVGSGSAVQISIQQTDMDAFERLLAEVQDAFGREDYAALRAVTTPEVMSYLSEELSQNATHGRRNQVTDTRLLRSDLAEAWSENGQDYATVAMRYESIDVMVDRTSGRTVEGDPGHPTQTTELWTFVRQGWQPWKLSAIQQAV